MDLATLIGIIGGLGVVISAIVMGNAPALFINIPSLVIVIGGTLCVTLTRVSIKQFMATFKVALYTFIHKNYSPRDLINEAVELATVARKEGILALEERTIAHAFLNQGISLCIDGHPAETVNEMLEREMDLNIEREKVGIRMFIAIGDAAPAMGMIGTLIGLVQMLATMEDPKTIGPSMAVALLTTLYGAVIANCFAIPLSEKLKLLSEEDRLNKMLILESVAAIQGGTNPRVLQQSLTAFLPENNREDIGAKAA